MQSAKETPGRPRKAGTVRFDQLLVNRGLAESGEQARRMILSGAARCPGKPEAKAGTKLPEDIEMAVATPERFVSRGGYKLEKGLDEFGVEARDKVCLDVGASTGGFTDCLLQRGARRVYALDVGHGQLHWKIRSDARVVVGEGVNARHLTPEQVPEPISLAVADVSFISLTLILPSVFAYLAEKSEMIVLVKPQFELSRELVEKGGVVRDPARHELAVAKIRDFVERDARMQWEGVVPSPILGAKGNREFVACLRKS